VKNTPFFFFFIMLLEGAQANVLAPLKVQKGIYLLAKAAK